MNIQIEIKPATCFVKEIKPMEIEQVGDHYYRIGSRLRNGQWVPYCLGSINAMNTIGPWLKNNRPFERVCWCERDSFWTENL